MHNTQLRQFQTGWQGAKPVQSLLQLDSGQLLQCLRNLAVVVVSVSSEEFAGQKGVRGVVCQSIQFVIAHDGQSGVVLAHIPTDLQHVTNLRTAVDEVTAEDDFAFRVPEYG